MTKRQGSFIFLAALLAALWLPLGLTAQVEEARVHIDGMV